MFCLCRTCCTNGNVQKKPCSHIDKQRSWIDVYTPIDIERAIDVGYTILEYKEIWHYPKGGKKIFRDCILNIVKEKLNVLGFLQIVQQMN